MTPAFAIAPPSPGPAHPPRTGVPNAGFPHSVLALPVLVIEDEALIAWMVESLLDDLGFVSITIVPDAEAALDAATRTKPGLIVSDINLGEGKRDGIDAAAALRTITGAPIVFVTAYADARNLARMEALCERFAVVRKPIAHDPLVAALKLALGPALPN